MDDGKQLKSEDKKKDIDDQSFEHLHRNLFTHPNDEEWNATRSLDQPSFLKQINSHGSAHSQPMKVSPTASEQ